ncbi:MAG: ABC transporter permease [Pseudomonadota bacterium]
MTTMTAPAWQFLQCQWLNLVRQPGYTLPTLLFPVMFYAFFGLLMIPGLSLWLLCTYATFGVMGAALFSFGVSIAIERGQGWLLLLRASPAPIGGLIVGKTVAAMLFGLIIVALLSILAAWFGDVRLAPMQWLGLFMTLMLGTIPFCLLGLSLGLLLSPNAAPAVINIVYLPLAFLSGLWIPTTQFPSLLQGLAAWLPPYHLAELALNITGAKSTAWVGSVLILLAYSGAFALLTVVGWKRLDGSRS